MLKLTIAAFLLLVVQGLLSYLQITDYRKRVSELKKIGIVAVGSKKGILGPGSITILACDKNGRVVRGEKLEGITIFERFKRIKGIEGLTLRELKSELSGKKHTSMLQAIESLEKRLGS